MLKQTGYYHRQVRHYAYELDLTEVAARIDCIAQRSLEMVCMSSRSPQLQSARNLNVICLGRQPGPCQIKLVALASYLGSR